MRRLFLKMAGASAVTALVAACGGTDDGDDETAGNMLDLADRSGEISALAAAARRAGLAGALSDPNANLTVMAPENAAWGLLAGQFGYRTIQELLDALPVATVRDILLYHVFPTRLSRSDLRGGPSSRATLLEQNGSPVSLPLDPSDNGLGLTDSIGRIGLTAIFDVPADNGVIHVIDRVLIPSGLLTVLQTVQSNPERFGTLLGALQSVPTPPGQPLNPVMQRLADAAPVTLFAPVEEAFTPQVVQAVQGFTSQQLTTVLTYHAVGSAVPSSAIPFGTPVATLAGPTITINNNATPPAIATIDDGTATDARITQVDIACTNGFVHVIDKVLLPPS